MVADEDLPIIGHLRTAMRNYESWKDKITTKVWKRSSYTRLFPRVITLFGREHWQRPDPKT